MAQKKKSSGLFERIDSEILHAVGLGALIATVGMGISLVAGTAAIATSTALIAMGVGAAVGIGAMIGSVVLGKKAEESKAAHPNVVIIQTQGQGIVKVPELEQSATVANENSFAKRILAERARASEHVR